MTALYKSIHPTSICTAKISIVSIKTEQLCYNRPVETVTDEERLLRKEEKIWIPSSVIDLRENSVRPHCGEKRHGTYAAIISAINQEYWWGDMKHDIKEFFRTYIRCIISKNRERIPQPLSTALHGEKRNEVIHADSLYMRPAENKNMNYIFW